MPVYTSIVRKVMESPSKMSTNRYCTVWLNFSVISQLLIRMVQHVALERSSLDDISELVVDVIRYLGRSSVC